MRFILTLITVSFVLLIADASFAQSDKADTADNTDARIVTLQQARQSLQLAKLAADNDLTDLSLKAVRESLSGGPPIDPLSIAASSGTGISTSTLKIGSTKPQKFDQTITEIYQSVSNLEQLWTKKDVEASRVYETLRDVVLPPGRPTEIFLYAPPLKGNDQSLPDSHHLGRLLIEYAQQGGQLENLKQHIGQRMESPRARVPAHVLSCEIALLDSDESEIKQLLDNLPDVIQNAHDSNEREMLNHFVLRVISIPSARRSAIPLYEQIIDQYPPSSQTEKGRLEPISSLLLSAAKLRIELGDIEKSRTHIERFLQVNEANNRRYDGDYAFSMERAQLEQAAIVYLEGNMIDDALEKYRSAMALAPAPNQATSEQGHYLFVRMMKLLQETPAEKRFQVLLEMVAPDDGEVVMLTEVVSDLKTPELFLQAVSEAHRGDQLNLNGYGPAGLLLSPGSMLVETAAELNRLDELQQKIKPLYEADNANARALWTLCLIERNDEKIIPFLKELSQKYTAAATENVRFTPEDIWKDVLITSGALKMPEAAGANLALISALSGYCQKLQQWPILARLRVIQAEAIARSWKGTRPRPFANAPPALWDSASQVTALEHLQGGGKSYWFVQEGHLQHLGGGHDSGIYFRYPLTGEFTLEAQIYDSGWAESEMAYGGVVHKFQCWSASGEIYANGGYGRFRRPNLFTNRQDHGIFLKHSLEITPGSAVHKINGHPVHTDAEAAHSPWIGFRAVPHSKSVVKRVKIMGEPVIPREVKLSASPLMRGWLTSFYGESRPPALYANTDLAEQTILTQAAGTNWDWRWEAGEILGKKVDSQQQIARAVESHIAYERPLFSGDRMEWEFFYKPGEELVHPAVGRMSFLLRPEGIKLHWMTDGPQDPNGLPAGHELDDPQGRRGPNELPLQEGWNKMQLVLEDDLVRLSLNEVTVYEHIFETLDDRGFGFFHFKDRTTARVRNVVLSGDWPETLPPELRESLLVPRTNDLSAIEHYALSMTIGRQPFYYDTLDRYLEAFGLPDEQRYQSLQEWVIPEPVQPFWRVDAAFTPTMMPPHQQEKFGSISQLSPTQQQLNPETGGLLVSPAVELVATARRLNRIPELRQRIESQWANPSATVSTRSKQVLLLLCDLAEENSPKANQSLLELETTLPEVKAKSHYERWPSVVAASQAMLYDETRLRATSLLKALVTTQIRKGQGDGWIWDERIVGLWGLAEYLTFANGEGSLYGSPPNFQQWAPAVHTRGDISEYGVPWAQWARIDNSAHHMTGNLEDVLYFQSPLMGDFTVEAYVTSFGWRETTPIYGNRWVSLKYQKDRFDHGTIAGKTGTIQFDPPFENVEDGYRIKLEVKDNRFLYSINDRKIHEGGYDAFRDPWLGIRSRGNNHGMLRGLKISGTPVIPEEILLSINPDLSGWLSTFFQEQQSGNNQAWLKVGEEIEGRHAPDRAGMFDESLLQYHRPLPQEAELSYEFQYDAQSQEVHPAIGRLAFLLKPEGVRVHWLTNGRFNQHGLDPAGSMEEPDHQKHNGSLPLKVGEFNQMKVRLKGHRVQLVLNDELIFERELNAGNTRLFGLFHYSGQSEAVVKNVRLKGNWPKQLPSLENQELALSRIATRESNIERLTDRYEIDFRQEKPPSDKFSITNQKLTQSLPEGLKITSPGQDKWSETQIGSKCSLKGDFDVALSFQDLSLSSPGESYQAMVSLFMAFPAPFEGIRSGFTIDSQGNEFLGSVYTYRNANDKSVYLAKRSEIPTGSGTYRIVREGAAVHYLFAPEGSDQFQKLFTQIIHDHEIPAGGLRIRVVAGQKGTETSVVATSLKIAAEEIIWQK